MAARIFTRAEILTIRRMADGGTPAPIIARLFPEVGLETLRRIIRRETYREIGEVARELERPRVAGSLEGEAPATRVPGPVEAEAIEALNRMLAEGLPEPAPESDPVQAFLGIRRDGNKG
jgi:hypothetical protein